MKRIGLLVLMLLASIGCDHSRVEETSSEELRYAVTPETDVQVLVDRGHVDVSEGPDDVVRIVVRKVSRARDEIAAEALLESVTVEAEERDGRVRVRVDTGRVGQMHFGGVRANLELRVPRHLAGLDVRTQDGRVTLDGVSGNLRAETGDGRVRALGVSGRIRLRTEDGAVMATDVSGELDAATEDGRMQLEGSFDSLRAVTTDGSIRVQCVAPCRVSKDWTLRTLDGSVELSLPDGASARVDASTSDGRIVNRLTAFDGAESPRRIHGTLGSGGALILVTTMDGRVTLKTGS